MVQELLFKVSGKQLLCLRWQKPQNELLDRKWTALYIKPLWILQTDNKKDCICAASWGKELEIKAKSPKMSLCTGKAFILYGLPSRGCSSSWQKRIRTHHGNLIPTWLTCAEGHLLGCWVCKRLPRGSSGLQIIHKWREDHQGSEHHPEDGIRTWNISTWKQTGNVEITLKTNIWKRLGRSSREDVKEIMRHKWLSENRKLQRADEMLMTEKWKQPKQVMKGELRYSKSTRLFTGGLRRFEAKDTVRKVLKRGWGPSRKEIETKSRDKDEWHKARHCQRPKGARVLCTAAQSSTKAGVQPRLAHLHGAFLPAANSGWSLTQGRYQRERGLQSGNGTDHLTSSKS